MKTLNVECCGDCPYIRYNDPRPDYCDHPDAPGHDGVSGVRPPEWCPIKRDGGLMIEVVGRPDGWVG